MKKNGKESKTKKGYAVLELLFYIAFFSILSLVVINAMVTMTGSFRETAIHGELVESAGIMERMSREIRQAYDINSISGTSLKINTRDEAGAEKTVEFRLSGSNMEILENNILVGNLNSESILVTSLSFTQITTAEGKAVKTFLTVGSRNDRLGRLYDLHNTIVLRGSY